MPPRRVPPFPPLLQSDPGDWDALTLLAATVFLEAGGEPQEGKLAVAWVVRNRVDAWHLLVHQVILGPDGRAWHDGKPYEPFSCFNDSDRVPSEKRLAAADPITSEACWQAAASGFWRLQPDPTARALFYLNPELTRQLRGGTFPEWAADPHDKHQLNAAKVTSRIGRHVFLFG